MQAVKHIYKVPMTENLLDLVRGTLYMLATLVFAVIKLAYLLTKVVVKVVAFVLAQLAKLFSLLAKKI